MSKFLGFVHLYFVGFEESPLDICRAVKLQSLSHLTNSIVCAVLLLLVFQLVQKSGVCKWFYFLFYFLPFCISPWNYSYQSYILLNYKVSLFLLLSSAAVEQLAASCSLKGEFWGRLGFSVGIAASSACSPTRVCWALCSTCVLSLPSLL